MARVGNPLLARFWRTLHPRAFLRSSFYSLLVGLALLQVALWIGEGLRTPIIWIKAVQVAVLLWMGGPTLGVIYSLGTTLHRLRHSGMLSDLLQSPLPSRSLVAGLLLPPVIGLGLFWTGLVWIISHRTPDAYVLMNPGTARAYWDWASELWFTVPAVWLQVLFAAAVTLRVGVAFSKTVQILEWAVGLTLIAPLVLVAVIVPEISPTPHSYTLVAEPLLAPVKIIIALALIVRMAQSFRSMCRIENR
jgi:hypothetical protein